MATCTVSGLMQDLTGTAISGATIRARTVVPYFVTTIQIVPEEVTTTTSAGGAWSLVLIQGASVVLTTEFPPNSTDSAKRYEYSILVPATSTANLSALVTES
jgi:hypothetical protein